MKNFVNNKSIKILKIKFIKVTTKDSTLQNIFFCEYYIILLYSKLLFSISIFFLYLIFIKINYDCFTLKVLKFLLDFFNFYFSEFLREKKKKFLKLSKTKRSKD
jgi:hypothetical protein